jgi:hypothetical protein
VKDLDRLVIEGNSTVGKSILVKDIVETIVTHVMHHRC